MLNRHEKELEQVKRMNQRKEEDLAKRPTVEKRALLKRIRTEMKAREMMFRESMRISISTHMIDPDQEREQIKKVILQVCCKEFNQFCAFSSKRMRKRGTGPSSSGLN